MRDQPPRPFEQEGAGYAALAETLVDSLRGASNEKTRQWEPDPQPKHELPEGPDRRRFRLRLRNRARLGPESAHSSLAPVATRLLPPVTPVET